MTSITQQDIKSFLKNLFFLGGLILFLGGLYVCTLPEQGIMQRLFTYTSFYLMALLLLLWTTTLLQCAAKDIPVWNFDPRIFLLSGMAIALTTTIFLLTPPELRLQTDEGFLAGVSQSLFVNQTTTIPKEAVLADGRLSIIHTSTPTRPTLLSFLTNLLHRLKGYDLSNIFYVNYIGLVLLLLLISILITQQWGLTAGLTVQLAIVCHPILWHVTASGLADLLNALFFLISALAFYHHIRTPSSRSLILFILSLCLLAHVRYESGLFLATTVFFLLILRRKDWQHLRPAMHITPVIAICCLPLLWQRCLFVEEQAYYNPTIQTLGLQHLLKNLHSFGSIILSFEPKKFYYFPPLLTCGLISLGLFSVKIIKDRKRLPPSVQDTFFAWLIICITIHTLIMCSFVGGILGRYLTSRYFLIEAVFLSILAVIFIFSIVRNRHLQSCLFIAFLLLFLVQFPMKTLLDKIQMKSCPQTLYHRSVSHLLQNTNPQQSLLVIDYPMQYIIRGWAAIYPKTLNSKTDSIKKAWDGNEYKNIYYIRQSRDRKPVKEVAGTWTATLIKTSKIGRRSFVSLYTLKPKTTPAP